MVLWPFAALLYNFLFLKQQILSHSVAILPDHIYKHQLRNCDLFYFLYILIQEILYKMRYTNVLKSTQYISLVLCVSKDNTYTDRLSRPTEMGSFNTKNTRFSNLVDQMCRSCKVNLCFQKLFRIFFQMDCWLTKL